MLLQCLLRMDVLHQIFRIVLNHSDFFKDDLFFLFDFFWIKPRVVKEIGQQPERGLYVLIQYLDIEGRGLAARKRIHFTAQRINLPRDLGRRP